MFKVMIVTAISVNIANNIHFKVTDDQLFWSIMHSIGSIFSPIYSLPFFLLFISLMYWFLAFNVYLLDSYLFYSLSLFLFFISQSGAFFDVAFRCSTLIAALFHVIYSFGIKSDTVGNEKKYHTILRFYITRA